MNLQNASFSSSELVKIDFKQKPECLKNYFCNFNNSILSKIVKIMENLRYIMTPYLLNELES